MNGGSSEPVRPYIRVVVVDDCPDVRFLLGTILEMDGRFEIVGEAHDAAAGIDWVVDTEPDLVLVDLGLGRRDGTWLVRKLRGRSSDITLAVVTGSVHSEEHAAALDAGADSVHSKASLTSTMAGELAASVTLRRRGAVGRRRLRAHDPVPLAAS